MRLHLPKALLAAVLAACLSWPAGAFTSTTTPYTSGDTSTTFNGAIWTWDNNGSKVSDANANYTNYSNSTVCTGDASITDSVKFYNYFFNANATDYLGNTLRFDGADEDKTLITDWSDYVWIGGIITEAGNCSYTLGRDGGTNFKLNGQNAVNMIINSSFTFKTNASSSVAVEKGGTWSIAKGKSLTFDTGSTTISSGQNVEVTASGTVGTATLEFTGNIKNSGTLTIGSGVNMTVAASKTLNSTTITNNGTITLASGAIIALDQLLATSDFDTTATTTGAYTATNGAFTFATGDGTVSVGNTLSCTYNGATATVTWNDGNKTGTASVPYYFIAENDTATYADASANAPAWITVGEHGTLSAGSGTINTEINGGGTISVSAGSGELSVSAEKLREFTGDLVVNSGRFNEVKNGHVFSNVSVADGGQFCINDGYNYTESVSIAGTGWNASTDLAKAGALRLGDGATLSGTLTLTGDANLIVYNGAKGTLSGTLDTGGHALTVKGNGKLLFGSSVVIGSGEGNANIVADNAHIGVRNGGSLSILKDYTCKGLYSDGQGTITIGDATHTIVNSVERIELGDSGTSGKITTLTVSANSVLKITGANNDSGYKSASALLGEWSSSTTATIHGTLLSEGAALQAGDTGYTLNVESTGLVAAKGIKRAQEKNTKITVNLKGGSLILGDTGIAAEKVSSTSTGGVIGSYAENMTIASALSLTSGTTTIDTSKYNIDADNNTVTNTVTVPTTDAGATGSTITISGNISGSNGTKLEVTGVGKVILSGTNNSLQELILSGGTTTISGTTTVSGKNSSDTVQGIVAKNDTLTLTVSGILNHDDFKYVGSKLSGLSNGLSMWNNGGSGKVTVSGGTVEQKEETRKDIYAALKDVKLINAANMDTRLYAGAELSGASIGGTLEVGNNTTTTIKNSVTGSTASSIAKLTGSGTLKTTSGTTTVTNASGFSGTLEATGGSMEASSAAASIAALKANGGNINLLKSSRVELTELVIGANNTVGVYEGTSAPTTPATGNEGTLTVTNLTANSGSILNANLVLNGANLTLNGSLTMGSSLTLNNVNLVNWNTLVGNQTGNSIVLFTSVDELTLGDTTYKATELTEAVQVGAGTVFSNQGASAYNLSFGHDGVVSLMTQDTPEPTTATLSLLALMALAARRRRKA